MSKLDLKKNLSTTTQGWLKLMCFTLICVASPSSVQPRGEEEFQEDGDQITLSRNNWKFGGTKGGAGYGVGHGGYAQGAGVGHGGYVQGAGVGHGGYAQGAGLGGGGYGYGGGGKKNVFKFKKLKLKCCPCKAAIAPVGIAHGVNGGYGAGGYG
ncbi:uncharacterized protein LOC136043437 isoform X2 [Artemia franciscana]|uniref:uncharacterized protein LOC136043437 isoform X2 n=1 Tax=Artemia franciscana TaxID=6661 RepID=UPI0032DABE86